MKKDNFEQQAELLCDALKTITNNIHQWQCYSINCMEADTLQFFHCRSACQYPDGTGSEEILYQIGHTLNSTPV